MPCSVPFSIKTLRKQGLWKHQKDAKLWSEQKIKCNMLLSFRLIGIHRAHRDQENFTLINNWPHYLSHGASSGWGKLITTSLSVGLGGGRGRMHQAVRSSSHHFNVIVICLTWSLVGLRWLVSWFDRFFSPSWHSTTTKTLIFIYTFFGGDFMYIYTFDRYFYSKLITLHARYMLNHYMLSPKYKLIFRNGWC